MGMLARRGRAAGEPSGVIRERVHTQVEGSRQRFRDELTVIEALVRMGQVDGAVHAIEDQRMALRALATTLETIMTEALAERARPSYGARLRSRS
ncbi:MAG: hypothetical protein ACRDZO_12365 [Egibacteraceae bacterium]